MTPHDFQVGQRVTYVPYHAEGRVDHTDCERGRVSSINDYFVFVKFRDQPNGQACKPDQLVKDYPS